MIQGTEELLHFFLIIREDFVCYTFYWLWTEGEALHRRRQEKVVVGPY